MNLSEPEKIALAIIERDIAITKARLYDARLTMVFAREIFDNTDKTIKDCERQLSDLQARAKAITDKKP